MIEVELKVRLSHPEDIEARMEQLGQFSHHTIKEDVYFRKVGDERILPQPRYRLRREEDRATVTFKEKMGDDQIEVNREVEFEVSEAYPFCQFVHWLGFEPYVVKRKDSQVYHIDSAQVELTQVEHLGYFVEAEILCSSQAQVAEAEAELKQLLTRLGLDEEKIEPRPYTAMIQEVHPVRYHFIHPNEHSNQKDWPFEEIRD